ncbi:MAG TPA: hypothetical protein VJ571_01050 [Candidatus Nitrosotalea sp.]|nr:hypothetical protein [Candidatus Nitrosotalea sp.]
MPPPIRYPNIEDFFDQIEHKYTIKIRLEANNIPAPETVNKYAGSHTLAQALHIARERYIYAMIHDTHVIMGSPNPWADDLTILISAVKQMGMYEETEGLPKKYCECMDRYNDQLKQHQKLQTAFDNVSEAYEEIKEEKKILENQIKTLQLEIDTFRRK